MTAVLFCTAVSFLYLVIGLRPLSLGVSAALRPERRERYLRAGVRLWQCAGLAAAVAPDGRAQAAAAGAAVLLQAGLAVWNLRRQTGKAKTAPAVPARP